MRQRIIFGYVAPERAQQTRTTESDTEESAKVVVRGQEPAQI